MAYKIAECLSLSYRNVTQLNKIIDEKLPSQPHFTCKEVIVTGQAFDVYYRDVISCIRELFGNLDFASSLITAPERCYMQDKLGKPTRVYDEMHTADWWWEMQVSEVKSFRSYLMYT